MCVKLYIEHSTIGYSKIYCRMLNFRESFVMWLSGGSLESWKQNSRKHLKLRPTQIANLTAREH